MQQGVLGKYRTACLSRSLTSAFSKKVFVDNLTCNRCVHVKLGLGSVPLATGVPDTYVMPAREGTVCCWDKDMVIMSVSCVQGHLCR